MEIVSFVAERCRAEGRDPSGVPAAAPSTAAPAQPRLHAAASPLPSLVPLGGRAPSPCFSPLGSRGPTAGCEQDAAGGTSVRTWCRPCQRTQVGRSAWIRARACARGTGGLPVPASCPSPPRSPGGFAHPKSWQPPPCVAFPRAAQRCGSGGGLVLGDAVEHSVLLARAAGVKSHPGAGTRALLGSPSTGGAVRVSVPRLGRRTDGRNDSPEHPRSGALGSSGAR